MRFSKTLLDPIKISFLTSILSVIFAFLDFSSVYENKLAVVFFVATLAGAIIFIYSRISELYAAPEISIPVSLLFGVLLWLESAMTRLQSYYFEGGILAISCLAVFYFVVWKKGSLRIYLTVILVCIFITGIYLLQTYDSVLLFIGLTLSVMPLVLSMTKYSQEYFSQPKTPLRNLNIGLGVIAMVIFLVSCFVLVLNTTSVTEGNPYPGASLVLDGLLVGMIFLGSLSRFRQLENKPSKGFRIYWWGATAAISIFVIVSHPLLSRLYLLYGLSEQPSNLADPLWVVFACLAGVQILFWAHKNTRWQWDSFAVGSVGGLLLSYLLSPLVYVILFSLFVPGQVLPGMDIDFGFQLGTSFGVLILLATIFLAVYIGRPQNRLRAVAAACIAGLTASIFVFISNGAVFSVIASQHPIYDVAFTRVGYDEVGWTSALIEGVLYIHPWVYGVMAASLVAGLLPAILIGLTWPVKRNPTNEDRSNELSPSVPLQLLLLSLVMVILMAVFGYLDDSIANSIIGVGLKPWWKPEWIVPLTLLLPSLIFMGIIIWIFARIRTWERSPRNAILVCLSGLILIMSGFEVWSLGSSNVLIMFVLLGIGIEMFRHGLGLWKTPEPNLHSNRMPKLNDFDAFAGSVPTILIVSIGLLPMLVIAIGLAMIPIGAIQELQNVTAPPPGSVWLLSLLENAIQLTQVITFTSLFAVFCLTYSIYVFIDLISHPERIGFWWGKMVPLWEKLEKYFKREASKERRVRLLQVLWLLAGILFAVSVRNDFASWIIPLFILSYFYFKMRPGWFRKISWTTYNIAGLILLVAILSNQISILGPLVLLAGPALALIYRGLVVYGGDSRRTVFRSLFFPALGVFFSFYSTYLQPITIVQNGIARFRDGRWENVGAENSPISGDKKYSFLMDSGGILWITGYYGPEALQQNGQLAKVRIATALGSTTEKRSTFGMMLEQGGNYLFVNDQSLLSIVQTDSAFRSIGPRRPRPALKDVLNDRSNPFGKNAKACSTLDVDENYECPDFTNEITSVAIDREGEIWLGTSGSGVARFHHEPSSVVWDWEFFTPENSDIFSDRIIGMDVETNGNILALSPVGVSVRSPDGEWTNYSLNELGFDTGSPQAIFSDTQGRVWVGSSSGISMWDGSTWQRSSVTAPASISDFYEDGRNDIWALSSTGAWKFSDREWRKVIDIPRDPFWQNPFGFSSFYRLQPAGSGVYRMVEDQAGMMWFGGPHGLVSYDPETEQVEYFYPSNSGLPSENVQDLQLDTDGSLWVSTYTPNIAYRTELPIVGLSILMIGILLGVIYMGYQSSPWFRALQISKRLTNQPQNLLQEVHATFSDTDATEVLEALADQPLPDEGYSDLVSAFASATRQNQTPTRDKAVQLLDDLHDGNDLHWQPEFVVLYQFFVQGMQVQSISDIGNIHLAILRTHTTDNTTLTYNDSMPIELPVFVGSNINDALEMLGRTTLYLRKYMQVENPQDRLGFIADSLGAVERAAKDAVSITGAEGYFVREICELWLGIIRHELDVLSGHADLRVEFRTRQVRQSEEATLVLNIRNTGSSIANQVKVRLLPNEHIHIGEEATQYFEYVGAGSSVVAEFAIISPPTGDVRVSGEIMWSDRIEENNRVDFADVIRFYEATGQFERIPNPYVVGHPVKSAGLFQGRDDIFNFISHNIQSTTQSHTLVLYGQRRTGKTSILYQLLGGKLGNDYVPVLVDVQELAPGIQGMSDLFLELALRVESALEKIGIKSEGINEDAFLASPTRSFSRFLTGLEKQLGGRKIIYMFDEFELLEEKILQGKLEPESLGYLRSLMQHRDDLIFIFTGTHKLEQMSKDYWSIFFNIALHQQVSFMDKESAMRLIREPTRGRLVLDDLAVEKILSLTQGHPYFTQLICWALVNHCNIKERNYATLNDLNEVLKDIVHTGESYFAYVWTQISVEEKIILAALADRLSPGRNAISAGEIMEALGDAGMKNMDKPSTLRVLDGLTDLEILASNGQDGTLYSYSVRLIGEWVKSSKPLRHLVERAS